MKKLLYFFIVALLGTSEKHAQIGIGTTTPQAMLDVAGTLQVREETTLQAPLKLEYIDSETVTELTGNEIVLIADLADENIVKRVSLSTLSDGLDIPDINAPNTSVYKVKSTSNLTLLNLGLFNSWQKINFPANSPVLGNTTLVDNNGVYTVPSDGIYSVNIYFRYGTGVQLTVLSTPPQVGIIKRASGTTTDTLLDSRAFTGINLAVANVTLSETEINSIYEFNAGDKIYFALHTGGVSLSLLSSSSASFDIYKISSKLQ